MIVSSLYVAVGGFFGAISRFWISRYFLGKGPVPFPIGTFLINVFGSFLLGLLFGANVTGPWLLLAGTGFMGAFTTFSTMKWESIQLFTKREWRSFALYLLFTYLAGIGLAFTGIALGQQL